MKDHKKKDELVKDPDANYNPTDRDFQRTEEETDAVSKSEKEHEAANKRTEEGNTKPDKNKIS
jgi:hypothetical protein